MNLSETSSIQDLRYLKGVGPKRVQLLERLGIHSIKDLLYYFPRRYEDRSHFRLIQDLQPGETVTIKGEVLKANIRPIKRLKIVEVVVGDDTGMVYAVWFNQVYLKKQFSPGRSVILYGKVELYRNRLQMNAPEYEFVEGDAEDEGIHTGRITPIYPLTEGMSQRAMRTILYEVVSKHAADQLTEYFPPSFIEERGMMQLRESVEAMHSPPDMEVQENARKRLVFDEFLFFELILMKRIENLKTKYTAPEINKTSKTMQLFQEALPFDLTEDQLKVIHEIGDDLEMGYPMNRMLQGDVGCGKTLVAAFGLYATAQAGFQGALLVPTEILAEQHYRSLRPLLESLGISVALLTSSVPATTDKRERLVADIKEGRVSILIGTHAMLQESVTFKNLGMLVTDEQHKFGVYQRAKLLNQEPRPHQLVMTATPIPRTLALTLYGDLSVSTIKQLPKGRQPIKTYWINRKKQKKVFEYIDSKIGQGDQVYFIFPLIEETEKMDLLAAEKECQVLKKVFKKWNVGLVHGRMKKEERDLTMERFRSHEIHILVATSVIEVGVDHPNATMMVIENGERFGLAQLHQMRGRIGRGEKSSECFVFGDPKSDEGKQRLRIFADNTDGFRIAEEDMKLRGFGDFLGTRQSGMPFFRLANPIEDEPILRESRKVAKKLVLDKQLLLDSEWHLLAKVFDEMYVNY